MHGVFNRALINLVGPVQDVIDNFVARHITTELRGHVTRVADADAQTPEVTGTDIGHNILHAIAARRTTNLHLQAAGWQIHFIVHNEHFVRLYLVELGKRTDRLAGPVHEGHRFQQPHAARFRDLAVKL